MSVKTVSRNPFLQIERFNFQRWSTNHTDHREYGTVSVSAPPKEVVQAARLIIQTIVEKNSEQWRKSLTHPVVFLDGPSMKAWRAILDIDHIPLGIGLYQNRAYEMTELYTEEEFSLLIVNAADRDRQRFERLKAKHDSHFAQLIKNGNSRIPEHIRIVVWRRDQGACVRCGSRYNLEYDHIIPVSKGGATSVRNIELLCEKCNRSKSDKIQ